MTAATIQRSGRVELRLGAVLLALTATAWALSADRVAGMDAARAPSGHCLVRAQLVLARQRVRVSPRRHGARRAAPRADLARPRPFAGRPAQEASLRLTASAGVVLLARRPLFRKALCRERTDAFRNVAGAECSDAAGPLRLRVARFSRRMPRSIVGWASGHRRELKKSRRSISACSKSCKRRRRFW